MIPGSVLLQPQRLQRALARDASAALMDDLVRLAFCLTKDAADGAPALLRIEQAVEATVQAMLDAKSAGIQAAVQRFSVLFATVRQQIEAFVAEGFDDAGDLMLLITELLDALAGASERLTPAGLRQRVNDVFAVVADDLGITPAFIEESVWALFDGSIEALSQAPDDESPVHRANRREIARLLERIERHLRGLFHFPQLNADLVTDALLTLVKNIDFHRLASRAACSGKGLATCFRSGTSLFDLIHYSAFPAFGEGSVGAAAAPPAREQYCWYATWLLEYQNKNANLGVLPAAMADQLVDGQVSQALRDAFRPLSVVLSRWANLRTTKQHKSWKIIDLKKYIVKRVSSEKLTVYHLVTPAEVALFDIGGGLIPELDRRQVSSGLVLAFELGGVPLTPKTRVTVRTKGTEWLVDDGELAYTIEKAGSQLEVKMGGGGGWLRKHLTWPDGDKVWIDSAATKVMLGQRILHMGTEVKWQDAPIFKEGTTRYTFKLARPDLMEHFAFHSAWSRDMLNTLLHLISIERGDIASNTVNASWDLYEMILKLALRRPSSDVLGYWWDLCIPVVATVIASLEGIHTKVNAENWFAFWLGTLLAFDLGEVALYSYCLSLLRNLFLSSVTLLNQDTSAAGARPLNHEPIEPMISGFVNLSLLVLSKAIPRDKYTLPFNNAELSAGYWVGGGIGVGLLGGLLGATAAAGLARGTFNRSNYLKASLKGPLWGFIFFWPMVFLIKEGDTADGTYNPAGSSFAGYPAGGASSPYNLPYAAGTSVLWGQGNQGMFSHNKRLTYAFDLAMDQDDPVLAMRPGTVVDYFDWIPDNTDPTEEQVKAAATMAEGSTVDGQTKKSRTNFVLIRHDLDEDGRVLSNPINEAYDRDEERTLVTYAMYMHGRQGSVRSVFAARGIDNPKEIIGKPILRGMRIMLAGDTGNSFHNHLHIHIQPGHTDGRSIPMAFREIEVVPRILNTYTSQNEER